MISKILILSEDSTKHLAEQAMSVLSQAPQLEVVHFCLDDEQGKLTHKIRSKFYEPLMLLVDDSSFLSRMFKFWRLRFVRPLVPKILDQLRQVQPPAVLAIGTSSVSAMAFIKSRQLYLGTLLAALSGYNLDYNQVFGEVDIYLCQSQKQIGSLVAAGVDESKTTLVRPSLAKKYFETSDRERTISDLRLLLTMPLVVLIIEGTETGLIQESFLRLIRSQQSYQLAIVCKDQKLRESLEQVTSPVRHPVKIYSTDDNLHLLLTCASVVVGPLVALRLAQAAAKRVPIILTDAYSMEEQIDLNFLTKNRVVVCGRIPAEVQFLVESALLGKRITNLDLAVELLAEPKGSKNLVEVISIVNPSNSFVKVQNYQQQGQIT